MTPTTPADLLDTLASLPGLARSAQLDAKLAVRDSHDLQRVLAIPTRHQEHDLPGGRWSPALNDLPPETVTDFFKTPNGTMTLRPIQAKALVEVARRRGCVGRIPVGKGKTLLSLLAAEALKAQRVLLLIPAGLRGSLDREMRKYEPHFKLPMHRIKRVMAHQDLSLPRETRLFENADFDAVIIDEIDAFANDSVRRSRLLKYGRRNATVMWVVWSGTVFQKSVKDALYWFALALRQHSVLPLQRGDAEAWTEVFDPPQLGSSARPAGALHRFCEHANETPRQGWSRRAALTVGIVTAADEELGVALNLHERPLDMPVVLKDALKELNRTWCRPDGKEFWMALDLRRLERQMTAGFYYRWREEPPPEWITSRNGWASVVREVAGRRRVGMDSPHLVEVAAERGLQIAQLETLRETEPWDETLAPMLKELRSEPHFDAPEWRAWRPWRPHPEPITIPVELNDYLFQDAVAWGKEHVGVIWYLHDYVGERIAQIGGFPLFAAGADTIMDERGDRTIVASIKAHGVGKNLQMFCKALIAELPASGSAWQQLIGRHHREPTEHTQVDVWIYRHCGPYTRAWAAALRKARFMRDMNRDEQRILYGAKSFDDGTEAAFEFSADELIAMDALAKEDETDE